MQAFGPRPSGAISSARAWKRPDWRDVDVRLMMTDEAFAALFPDARLEHARWEFDPRWLLMTASISAWLAAQTGLPIDFQFQPMTFANETTRSPATRSGCALRNETRPSRRPADLFRP